MITTHFTDKDIKIMNVKEFPIIMKRGSLIVFFVKQNEGFILVPGSSRHPIGTYRSDWVVDGWERVIGDVILTQTEETL